LPLRETLQGLRLPCGIDHFFQRRIGIFPGTLVVTEVEKAHNGAGAQEVFIIKTMIKGRRHHQFGCFVIVFKLLRKREILFYIVFVIAVFVVGKRHRGFKICPLSQQDSVRDTRHAGI